MKKVLLVITFLCNAILFSQAKITGNIYDIYLEPIPSINISSEKGLTTTDDNGNFVLTVKQSLPITIKIYGIGYKTQTIEIVDFEGVSIVLEKQLKLQEVVISASRTPERLLESPVSVERLGSNEIKKTSSLNFYEGLVSLKGIDVLHNSYSIKNIVSNRGFANTENTRFVQLVDGVESTLPFINYSLGNSMGVSDLDINTVEILPGAASALYGPNAFNGIMLMTSKNPFKNQGVSAYLKGGVTTQQGGETNEFIDVGIRLASAFSKKFAGKVNFTYNKAEEWHATDYRNTSGQGGEIIEGLSHSDDVGYDGLNVYGDEVNTNLIQLGIVAAQAGLGGLTYEQVSDLFTNTNFSRIGYAEKDLIDYDTKNLKLDASLHYRPFENEDLELTLGAKYNFGDNIIHAYNRYDQKGGLTQQYRATLNGKNFFLKGYYTHNFAKLVDTRLLGIYINSQTVDDITYASNLVTGYLGSIFSGQTDRNVSIIEAQNFAETGRVNVEDPLFDSLLASGKSTSIQDGGALLTDKSIFYHVDGNYNFRDLIKIADIQIGGSYRDYELNSGGDIYTDSDRKISTKEYGVYTQAQKKFFDEHLKLTFTARYDKSDNFAYKVSPRGSIAYAIGENKNHNIRLSYQTGFRNPTTQDQYANISLDDKQRITGTVKDNLERVNDFKVATSQAGQDIIQDGVFINEDIIFDNSYTKNSADLFTEAAINDILLGDSFQDVINNNSHLLEKSNIDYVKPETVQTFELGYRGAVNISNNLFEFDIATFYNIYENFLTYKSVVVPLYGDVDLPILNNDLPGQALLYTDSVDYILRTNTSAIINSYGFNIGFTTQLFGEFNVGANYAFSKFEDDGTDTNFNPSYNTPENVVKLSVGHDKLFKNIGFKINARWQDEYLYQSVFIQDIIEARTVLDAQINYTIPTIKSRFKLGATNLGGKAYTSVPGAGTIGSQYYLNWTINN